MGRTSDARSRILVAARSLLGQRGYSGLGVAEICRAAGVPKGSFYYFFESKEALALAVIDAQWTAERHDWERILGTDAEPLQRLRQLLEATEARQRAGQGSYGAVLGCMFGNLSLEMSNQADAIRLRLQEIFEAEVDLVEAVVSEAHRRGEVTLVSTRDAARSVVAQLEGQVLFAKLYNNPSQLGAVWLSCLALLGVHAGRHGDRLPHVQDVADEEAV
ncbi:MULTISPECIES: TetR/AcrR family transcriptional regulator [Streptomyces]|uniref:TetR family transcriptional regulator n=1 Tax=Streptomyces parvulus TaxID=146923 RepID=A0A191VAW1_9ACTN|nr:MULTISPECIES: TetR/AcrR family transcriptional regulator [Streptomyces]ANJ12050.1 TetR family transcriptional regulator [Streptomyces parvulus]MZD59252.1 TetR family transcriptional regulator [Streptomyces sp. SID5606]